MTTNKSIHSICSVVFRFAKKEVQNRPDSAGRLVCCRLVTSGSALGVWASRMVGELTEVPIGSVGALVWSLVGFVWAFAFGVLFWYWLSGSVWLVFVGCSTKPIHAQFSGLPASFIAYSTMANIAISVSIFRIKSPL